MKFDDLDSKMRVFETAHDLCVLPGIFMVARIDGRSFTRLTKDVHAFEAPFDVRFRDYMVETVRHLMADCGFRAVYGYTQSDEISILFHRDEDSFGRKLRKFDSVLAGEASARFSLLLGALAAFDCRISQLPTMPLVVDYFRWRNEDAHRNALNAHCYWALRKSGESVRAATERLLRLSVADKNELLYQLANINFNDVPSWQKRGVGLYWEEYQKEAMNPKTNQMVLANRRRLKVDMDLPMKDIYSEFIEQLLKKEHSEQGNENQD
jgi:tRNA(His) guanylyltransferase